MSAARGQPIDPRSLTKTIDGVRQAWSHIEEMWATTFLRVGELPESAAHERVNDEWSFVETQRHLVFVTDAWVRRTILTIADPYHPIGLPPDHKVGQPDEHVDVSAFGIDVFADASLATVLDVRTERMRMVRSVISELPPDGLRKACAVNPQPGFPPSTTMPVGFCLELVVGEEWAHHEFASRDLAILESR